MRNARSVSTAFSFALLSVFSAACSEGGKVTADQKEAEEETGSDVNAFILAIPNLAVAPAQPKTEISCDGLCPDPEQDGESYCTYSRYTETAQFDEFVAFQPNSATLWPGVIVRGEDAANGVLTPVGVPLAPVKFSVSLENLVGSPVGEMADPSLSSFREEQSEILSAGVDGATAASLDFEVIEVNSTSQLSVALGASVSWPGGPDIAASFDFASSEHKTKILVNFTQAYYTVDVDTHGTPAEFFADGTTVDDLTPWMNEASPPLYVQSITYGRRVIFSVQTDRSASEVKAALEASYAAAGVADIGVDVATEHKETLAESTIRAFVLGGSGDDATGAINGFEGLVAYIKNGGSYSKDSPGAPIAYKLAYLDNAVTQLAFTTDYAERQCTKNRTDLHLDLVGIEHVSGGDPGGNVEIFGQVVVRYPTATSPVEDCNTGGELAWVWISPDGSWISFPELTTWYPSAPTSIDLHDLPVDADQKICLIADMWEEDGSTGELSSDDDFGIAGTLISFKDGWPGEHHVLTHGTGDNSLDVQVDVSMP
ncbi:MAG: thiol-activated cytolysin family protein [Myxococcales bacterium]|nr:thiol-activated cytolysin family protein [Myxococcales bacterium]